MGLHFTRRNSRTRFGFTNEQLCVLVNYFVQDRKRLKLTKLYRSFYPCCYPPLIEGTLKISSCSCSCFFFGENQRSIFENFGGGNKEQSRLRCKLWPPAWNDSNYGTILRKKIETMELIDVFLSVLYCYAQNTCDNMEIARNFTIPFKTQ